MSRGTRVSMAPTAIFRSNRRTSAIRMGRTQKGKRHSRQHLPKARSVLDKTEPGGVKFLGLDVQQNLPTTRLSRHRHPASRATTTCERQRVMRPKGLHRAKLFERNDHRSYRSCRQSRPLSSRRYQETNAHSADSSFSKVKYAQTGYASRLLADGETSLMERWLGPATPNCHCSNWNGAPRPHEQRSRAGHVRTQSQRGPQNLAWFCRDSIAIS